MAGDLVTNGGERESGMLCCSLVLFVFQVTTGLGILKRVFSVYLAVDLHRAVDLLMGDVDGYDRHAYNSLPQLMSSTEEHLPFRSSRRVRAQDAKLLARDEDIADGREDLKRACLCNVCIAGVRDVLLRKTVRTYLNLYGRHPFHRGSTWISFQYTRYLFLHMRSICCCN